MRALGQATSALEALTSLLPDTAERVTDGGTEVVALNELRPGTSSSSAPVVACLPTA